MNILPKKRWHVRTKDNIARVRKDEALAAEEEKKKQLRIQIAEREKRREELRKRARERTGVQISQTSPKTTKAEASSDKHVNLFYELEQNEIVSDKTNKEYLEEKQLEKEKYEKQIGYLTYLGQDTNEITGNISWYNKPRNELHMEQKEIAVKQKSFEDPLGDIRKYLSCEGIQKIKDSVKSEKVIMKNECNDLETNIKRKKHKKKHKKHKKKHKKRQSSSESEEVKAEIKRPNVDLERLRAERITREQKERKRANELFARLNGVTVKEEKEMAETCQKYNSQFNPHLAKQNNAYRSIVEAVWAVRTKMDELLLGTCVPFMY